MSGNSAMPFRMAGGRSHTEPALLNYLPGDHLDLDKLLEEEEESQVLGWFPKTIDTGIPKPRVPEKDHQSRPQLSARIAALALESAPADEKPRSAFGMRATQSAPAFGSDIASKESLSAPQSSECCISCGMFAALWDAIRGVSRKKTPEATIIFDWDDTLFPTTFIMREVWASLMKPNDPQGFQRLSPKDRHYDSMAAHAHLVEFCLRTTRRYARVAIVTLSKAPWVIFSSSLCLPGLDIDKLLRELDIPVYYSRGWYEDILANSRIEWDVKISPTGSLTMGLKVKQLDDGTYQVSEVAEGKLFDAWNQANPSRKMLPGDVIFSCNGAREGLTKELVNSLKSNRTANLRVSRLKPEAAQVNPSSEAKRIDMEKCLSEFYQKSGTRNTLNVVSVGDSIYEHIALGIVLEKFQADNPSLRPLCKTVNLLDAPTLDQLNNELKILLAWLQPIVQYDDAFNFNIDSLTGLEQDLLKLGRK